MQDLEVLRRPIITEKSTALHERGKYTFEVEVVKVNVITVHPKWRGPGRRRGLTSASKKAVVTLKKGQKIDFFEGSKGL
jgi:large subunit ribosomal protein L23